MNRHWFAVSLIGAFACSGAPEVKLDTDSESETDAGVDTDTTLPPSPTVTAAFTPATVAAGETA